MNNILKLMVVALAVSLSACASKDDTNTRNYRYAGADDSCSDTLVRETRPVQQIRYQEVRRAPVQQVRYQEVRPVQAVSPCGGCQAQEYTVRTPVKVVYKNTTYRTVYEPRTYESTSFETRPFNRAEACSDGRCAMRHGVAQPTYLQQPAPQPVQQPVQSEQVVEEVVYEK